MTAVRFLLSGLLAGLAAATAGPVRADPPGAGAGAAELRFEPRRCRVEARAEADRTLLRIESDGGIGDVGIARTGAEWPRRVVLRFRYADGRPLRVLEGFTLETETERIEARSAGDGIAEAVPRAGATPGAPAAERIPLRFTDTPEGLEVELPVERMGRQRAVTVRWVDYYRR